jgi:DNA-binding CsgD family transcriptional regulator
MSTIDVTQSGNSGADCAYLAIFSTLTVKQHEVFALLAEGRTSKEIAWRLGVTDSAIVQRIEAVRSRAGSPPRAELAREYRLYIASQSSSAPAGMHPAAATDSRVGSMALADGPVSGCADRWSRQADGLIVPGMFAGPNAGLNRMAAMVVIALGLLAVAMVGLGVAQAVANLL